MTDLGLPALLARLMRRGPRPSEAEITLFTQELAWMLRSEVPLGRAIDLLLTEAGTGAMAPALRGMRADLRAGSSLAEAMGHQGDTFPQTYLRLVAMAERAGTLPMVMARLHEGRARAAEWRKRVSSAMIYPAFLLLVALAAVALIVLAVLPQLRAILPETPAPGGSDRAIRQAIALSDWIAAHGVVTVLGALGVMAAMSAVLARPRVRLALTETAARLPVIGGLIRQARLAELTRTLAMLIEAGLPLDEALRLARRATPAPALVALLKRMENALREGVDVTVPLREDASVPPLLASLMKVGQETGSLGQSLSHAAAIFEEKTRSALDRSLALLEPALILIISIAVGSLIYLVIGALMSVNDLFL